MKLDNRVLQRMGARELTVEETERILGGLRTLTICTIVTRNGLGGDEGISPETC